MNLWLKGQLKSRSVLSEHTEKGSPTQTKRLFSHEHPHNPAASLLVDCFSESGAPQSHMSSRLGLFHFSSLGESKKTAAQILRSLEAPFTTLFSLTVILVK